MATIPPPSRHQPIANHGRQDGPPGSHLIEEDFSFLALSFGMGCWLGPLFMHDERDDQGCAEFLLATGDYWFTGQPCLGVQHVWKASSGASTGGDETNTPNT